MRTAEIMEFNPFLRERVAARLFTVHREVLFYLLLQVLLEGHSLHWLRTLPVRLDLRE